MADLLADDSTRSYAPPSQPNILEHSSGGVGQEVHPQALHRNVEMSCYAAPMHVTMQDVL